MRRPTLIIGFDGTERADDALALGIELAGPLDAEIVLANVYRVRPAANAGLGDVQRHVDEIRDEAARALASATVPAPVTRRVIAASSPARGLRELAAETGAAMVVIGSTHRGRLGRITRGTTGGHLLHGASCALAVAPAGYATGAARRLERIAVAYNDTDEAVAALHAAISIARALGTPLRVTVALELVPQAGTMHGHDGEAEFFAAMRREAQDHLDGALAVVPEDIDVEGVVIEGDAAEVLSSQDDVGLLVLGTSEFGRFEGALLGSVSSRVVRGSDTPVLIVPKHSSLTFSHSKEQTHGTQAHSRL